MKVSIKNRIDQTIQHWRYSTSVLEQMMDLVIIILLSLLVSTCVFILLLYGFSINLSTFETLWFTAFLLLTTLSLRLYSLHLKEESNTTFDAMLERKILLYWAICLVIALTSLSLSLAFPYIKGVQT